MTLLPHTNAKLASILAILVISFTSYSQTTDDYYFPDQTEWSSDITSPSEFLGWNIGEWHVTHTQLLYYMRHIAHQSDRIHYLEHGKSHEGRPLFALIISDPKNIANLESLRQQHLDASDINRKSETKKSDQPLVVWQGYSIHGNEASGSNAAILHAYNLAANSSAEIKSILANTIIILYPSFNPDGLQRFSTWVNSHKNKTLTSDPQDIEYRETWPGGRTNHYWFDLNRDWLPIQQPESQAKIDLYQQWRPNILTDHHEMGSNSTFFFQPGIPSRTNPLTPEINQELTAQIATFHAQELDNIGSLYYAKESFDDFYYGKGSTYPDIQGCIGILFEQASSRGHLQETDNGLLSFPFTIRNQLLTSISTLKAGLALKEKLQTYQSSYYAPRKTNLQSGYVYGESDYQRLAEFTKILLAHDIQVYRIDQDLPSKTGQFNKDHSFFVPSEQRQSRLIETIFEKNIDFKDSLFYDVSAWTLPLAFDLPHEKSNKAKIGQQIKEMPAAIIPAFEQSSYAYVIPWSDYLAPKLLYQLLSNQIRVKVAQSPFLFNGKDFGYGSLMVILQNQDKEMIESILKKAHLSGETVVYALQSGMTDNGFLGSPSFASLRDPKIGIVVGDGVTSSAAGEAWHLLDTRYQIPVTKIQSDRFSYTDLSKYNTIVLAGGSINRFSKEKLSNWIKQGGNLIAMGTAGQWLQGQGLGDWSYKNKESEKNVDVNYEDINTYYGARYTGGCIVQATIDLSNPLLYGYSKSQLPIFKNNNTVFNTSELRYKSPIVYNAQPLLSGYLHPSNESHMANGSAVQIRSMGSGRIINFADNPNFRAFWYGTNKIFANAVFFGHLIQSRATN